MRPLPTPRVFRFGAFEFDSLSGELHKGPTRMTIQPQPSQLLALLLSRAPELVTREEIQQALWPEAINVDFELGINRCIRQLRAVLLDDAAESRFVQRVPRRGYRFIAGVSVAGPQSEVPLPALTDSDPSIAVLPFANLSGNPDDEYFSDGLAEEITNVLVQAGRLKVIARTSAFAFKGRNEDIRSIAQAVGVTNVLEGSVRRAGNRLRITAQLIRASDGFHLFSKRYDRETSDIFAIQDEISADVARTLEVHLAVPRHSTVNLQAYEALLEGRFHWHKYTPAGFASARRCFERAAAIDPGFSSPQTGIAEYFLAMVVDAGAPAREFLPQGLSAARRALECDRSDADAHAALAQIVTMLDYDWEGAGHHFQKARELKPGPHTGIGYATWFLLPQGRCEEAAFECDRVIQGDPLLLVARTTKATALLFGRAYARAAEACQEALAINPEFAKALQILAYVRGLQGRFVEGLECARELLRLLGRSHLSLYTLGLAHAAGGARDGARRALDEMESLPGGTRGGPTGIACVHALLGEKDEALYWMKEAIACRDPRVLWMKTHPWADSLRNDPRYIDLLRRMNLQGSTIPVR